MLSGCWDTVTTMSPGETIELDEMTFGNEYVINGCQVTRTLPDGIVLINEASLSIFSEVRDDKKQARQKYLFRNAQVTGLVTDVSDWDHSADDIEITITDKTVECELNTQFTAVQLNSMLGKTVTLKGKIEEVWFTSVDLYDCSVVPAR